MQKSDKEANSVSAGFAGLHIFQNDMFFTVLAACFLVLWVFGICWLGYRGIEFSDEGFYLNWIVNTDVYKFSYTHFGFLYSGLFELLGKDVALLRIASSFIAVGLATLFSYLMVTRLAELTTGRSALAISLLLGTGVMLQHVRDYVLTPSYNTGNGQALLLCAACGTALFASSQKPSFFWWPLLGLAATLIFLNKPTTAVLTGIVFSFAWISSGRFVWHHGLVSLVTSILALVAFALLIDGSLIVFLERVQIGVEVLLARDAGYSLDKNTGHKLLHLFDIFNETQLYVVFLAAIIAIALAVSRIRDNLLTYKGGLVGLSVLILLWMYGRLSLYLPMMFYALAFGGLLALLVNRLPVPRHKLAWIVVLLFYPPISAFGTNGDLWYHAFYQIYFVAVLAACCLLLNFDPSRRQTAARLFSVALTLFTAYHLTATIVTPYRQTASLFEMNNQVEILGGELLLEESYARYIGDYRAISRSNGFELGTGIIDFSGRVPALPVILGGVNIGTPWMNGGYPGGVQSAAMALSHTPCKILHEAWLILEPGGPRELPLKSFKNLGFDLSDYTILGRVGVPIGVAGYALTSEQLFLKPLPEAKLLRCQ